MASRDLYEVLGVGRTATAAEIRAAHRKLAKTLHPDVNKAADAAKRFAEVQEAFDVLSDPEKRSQYDRFGRVGAASGQPGAEGGTQWRTHAPGEWEHVEVGDFSSVFDELFGGRSPFGEARGGSAGRARESAGHAAPGADLEHPIEVDFMTAATGGTRSVTVAGPDGTATTLDVRVPPGSEDGARLRVRGRGRAGRRGGAAGDLLLTIRVHPHPWFRREGLDILLDVPISIAEAALGASVEVPLLRGSATLRIPPGTSGGRKLRLRGKGIEDAKGRHGDFLAVIQVVAPAALAPEDARALRQLAERLPDPRADAPWRQERSAE